MHKLTILFHLPEDVDNFEERWSHEFVPMAEKMPGIRRVSVSRILGSLIGEADLHLVHEFYFDHADALHAAMSSPEGQAAGKTLMEFSAGSVSIYLAEHFEQPQESRK